MGYTMSEVAARAGVSKATVSRVLNRSYAIAPENERRVLEVVSQLKYHKNVVQLGPRPAAVIAGPGENRTAVVIKQALVAGLKEQKLKITSVVNSNYRVDAGASAVRALLAAPELPTVIFCGSDLIAMGAMNALEEAGVRIPEGVSMVGIDDISFAFLARPPLTTIRVPRERLGQLAFQALDKMLGLKRRKGMDHYLETELVVRQSTASPRNRELGIAKA